MNLVSFRRFLSEERKSGIVITFGRFQPPTIGHEKLLNAVANEAKTRGYKYRIFASMTHDAIKNPLQYKTKVAFMRKMFPQHARQIDSTGKYKTILQAAAGVNDEAEHLVVVVGEDRVKEFQNILNKYNGVKNADGTGFKFKSIEVISAGDRDPDATGVEGMSASKMREAALKNDFAAFSAGMPKNYDARELFIALRKAMDVHEKTLEINLR